MANTTFYSPVDSHGNLAIPVAFFKKQLDKKIEQNEAKLRSEAVGKTWEVKIEGRRFAGGWEEFAGAHDLRAGDMLLFRHEGDMVFRVTAYGPNRCEIQYALSRLDDDHKDADNNIGIRSTKNKTMNSKTEAESVSESESESDEQHSGFEALVTGSSLRRDKLTVPIDFARTNGLDNNRRHEIVLMTDERGKSRTLDLQYRKSSGQLYISGGWKRFCCANGLEAGDSCTFKLVRNGAKPVLRLSPAESSDNSSGTEEHSESEATEEESCSEPSSDDTYHLRESSKREEKRSPSRWKPSSSLEENRFTTVTVSNGWRSRQSFLPAPFLKWNGIEKPCDLTLMDKDGTKWPSLLLEVRKGRGFYFQKNFVEFCEANGVKNGESFKVELLREGSTPTLKFCSKVLSE